MARFHSIPLSAVLVGFAALLALVALALLMVVLHREARREQHDEAQLSAWARGEMDKRTVVRRLRIIQRRHGVQS